MISMNHLLSETGTCKNFTYFFRLLVVNGNEFSECEELQHIGKPRPQATTHPQFLMPLKELLLKMWRCKGAT